MKRDIAKGINDLLSPLATKRTALAFRIAGILSYLNPDRTFTVGKHRIVAAHVFYVCTRPPGLGNDTIDCQLVWLADRMIIHAIEPGVWHVNDVATRKGGFYFDMPCETDKARFAPLSLLREIAQDLGPALAAVAAYDPSVREPLEIALRELERLNP